MGKKQHLDWTSKSIMSTGTERVSLLNKEARGKGKGDTATEAQEIETDIEQGDNVEAANVGFSRVLLLVSEKLCHFGWIRRAWLKSLEFKLPFLRSILLYADTRI